MSVIGQKQSLAAIRLSLGFPRQHQYRDLSPILLPLNSVINQKLISDRLVEGACGGKGDVSCHSVNWIIKRSKELKLRRANVAGLLFILAGEGLLCSRLP